MANQRLDALQLREVKYGSKALTPGQVAVARRLLDEGRTTEALDLFLLAGDEEGIAELRRRAVEEGRPHLLLNLKRAGREIAAEEWKRCAEAAFGQQRWREAYRGYSEAGDEAGLERVREKAPGYEPYTPQGK